MPESGWNQLECLAATIHAFAFSLVRAEEQEREGSPVVSSESLFKGMFLFSSFVKLSL